MFKEKKVDNLPSFPRNAVHQDTEAFLISEFEMGSDEPRSFGRPLSYVCGLFINLMVSFSEFFKRIVIIIIIRVMLCQLLKIYP